MNKNAMAEWLEIAAHDLKSAHILFDACHYTDSIATDIQQAIEKMLKSILVGNGKKIPKTHDLVELYYLCDGAIELDETELEYLDKATLWYKTKRYPNPNYSLPDTSEIKNLLDFTDKLSQLLKSYSDSI